MKKVLFLVFVFLILPIYSALAALPMTMKMNAWGCKSKALTQELMSLLADGDSLAWRKRLAYEIMKGNCVLFKEGEQVYATGFSPFSDLVKVRKKGDFIYYWVWVKAVKGE